MPVETFDRVTAVNIRGTMLCYKYAGGQMIKQGRGGRIIGRCWEAHKRTIVTNSRMIGASSVVGIKGTWK